MNRDKNLLSLCYVFGLAVAGNVCAEQIKLKDGTEFSATVLGKDADSVAVKLPRSEVADINGEPLPDPIAPGAEAPVFTAVDLQGSKHDLAQYRGGPVLLQFWATWCPHCRADLGLMKDLFARYQGEGLRIVTASIDEDINKLRSFVGVEQLRYPVIALSDPSASAQQAALAQLYEMQGVPSYYLIDAQGTIAKTFSGSVTETKRDLEGTVKSLLAASKASRSLAQ